MANGLRLAGSVKRIDLHCHSNTSNEACEGLLNQINCLESYSTPEQVFAQATRRGMDFVTLTDHDSLLGVMELADQDNVLIGEEVTCFFPEDRCRIHLLVYGISESDHDQLQSRAGDIYELAKYVADHQIAHSVAHPLYRNNDRTQRWHVEKLLLLFKGFELVNGAHSGLHRDALAEVLDNLTPARIQELARVHDLSPLWPDAHVKARTGGSDDHGLLNIGRTWTEFPGHVKTAQDLCDCLRSGKCRPAGSAGAGINLAHQFYSVAVKYFTRQMIPPDHVPGLPAMLMQTFVGEGPAKGERQLLKLALKHKLKGIGKKLLKPWKRKSSSGGAGKLLGKAFLESAKKRIREHPELLEAMREGEAAFCEHDPMFAFTAAVNRDLTRSLFDQAQAAIEEGRFTGIFDAIAATMAQQVAALPYYIAFFHQNKERQLLREMTGIADIRRPGQIRVAIFTDTLDEVNGVSRCIRDLAERAASGAYDLNVLTCSHTQRFALSNRKNFEPIKSFHLPYYPELPFNIPPVLEILQWADQRQFDAIEVATPGPMGLLGMLVAQMLRIPVVGTYHTDFPAYISSYTGDDRLVDATSAYMQWFYGRCRKVFTRSGPYAASLLSLGIQRDRILSLHPGIDTQKFNPRFRRESMWKELGIAEKYKLIYCGRVSSEKNLALLEQAFRSLADRRRDVALIVVGDGPYRQEMQRNLKGVPAYFMGYRFDEELSRFYASSDLCVFPSRTDTLGQVVGEAQASGVPVLVSDEGGPREMMDDVVTGLILSGTDPAAWDGAIHELLDDEPRRLRMARNAATRATRFSMDRMFEGFWMEIAACVVPSAANSTSPLDTPDHQSLGAISPA